MLSAVMLGAENPFSWLNTSLALLAMGAALLLLAPIWSSVVIPGNILLLLVPLKMLLVDAWFGCWAAGCPAAGSFRGPVIWIQLGVLCIILPLIHPRVLHRGIHRHRGFAACAVVCVSENSRLLSAKDTK